MTALKQNNKKSNRILIVEDESILAMNIQDTLVELSYEVIGCVNDGEKAIEKADKTLPDLILMDINLKGEMDGIDTAKRIKERHNVPVVFLTAYSDQKTIDRAKLTDPFGYIIKPFEKKDLHTNIEISLYKHRAEKELKEAIEKFNLISEHIREVFWIITPLCKEILYVNKAFENIWGRSCDTFYKDPRLFYTTIHEKDRERIINKLFAADFDHFNEEYRILRPDGSFAWIHSRGVKQEKEGPSDYVIVGSSRDITEQKTAEEQLFKNAMLYKHLSETSHMFSSINEPDLNLVLEKIVQTFETEHASIVLLTIDGTEAESSYTWTRQSGTTKDQRDTLHRDFSEIIERISNNHSVNVYSVNDRSNESSELKRCLLSEGAVTFVIAPLYTSNKTLGGFILLESINEYREWGSDEIRVVGLISEMLGVYLEKRRIEQRSRTLARVIEESPVSVVITDPDGTIGYVNPKFCEVSGYKADEAIGRTPRILKSGKQSPAFYKKFWNNIKSGKEWYGEFNNKRKSGERYWERAVVFPLLDNKGHIANFIAIKEDITREKQMFEDLRKSEEQFRSVSEASSDGIVLTDKRGDIIYWNRGAEDIFGYEAEEIIGKLFTELIPIQFKEEYKKSCEHADSTDHVPRAGERFEVRGLKKDGSEFPVEITLDIWHAGGRVYYSSIIRDITFRKEKEDELLKAKEAAEIANIAKSEFLARMSHEIRTPMNGIIGTTDLLLQTDLNKKQRDYLKMTKQSAKSLLSIINDILDFSKIEAGRMELENIDFDLIYTIETISESLEINANEKGLDLYCRVKPSVPEVVRGDQVRLRQILINLIGNAIKFTDVGEIVTTIEPYEEYSDNDYVVKKGGRLLHFSVSDTGHGIPDSKKEHIFESFSQADGSVTRKFGGTGLGLTISRQLVNMMNGKMWIESEEGIGSVFHFIIEPGKASDTGALKNTYNEIALKDKKILIVESNTTSRIILSEMIEEWGCTLEESSEGLSGLRKIIAAYNSGAPFTTVLTGVRLNDMDGYEFVQKAMTNPKAAGSKIILLLNYSEEGKYVDFQEKTNNSALSGYILKPYKRAHVLSAITGEAFNDLFAVKATQEKSLEPMDKELQILLVEDNPVNQVVAEGILTNLGHNVSIAENGKAALEKLAVENTDIILMDIEMPEMNGIEATKAIRASDRSLFDPQIPVIAMTAYAMKGDREMCLNAGMNDYISKPLDIESLIKIIKKYVSKDSGPDVSPKTPTHAPNRTGAVDYISAIEAIGGNETLYRRIVHIYSDDIPGQLEKLKEAVNKGDFEIVRRQSHSIKGASANIRAEQVRVAALQLEKAGQKGDLSDAATLVNTLEEEINKVIPILKQLVENGKI